MVLAGGSYEIIPIDAPPLDDSWRRADLLEERGELVNGRKPRPRESRFNRISFGELRNRKAKAPDCVIDDWMVAREQSFIAGESQSGKSFLAMHAALCIATGRDVFGRRVQEGLVIYQAGESGSGVIEQRIPAWIAHYGQDLPASIPFEILPAKVDLFSTDGNARAFLEAIRNIAAEYAERDILLRAVFIDTLSKAMTGANENDGRDIGRVLGNCEAISRATGAHVCIVHHLPKNGTGMRGHGSLKGDVDSVAMLTVDLQTKIRTLVFDKMKDGEAGKKINFELMRIVLGQRDDGKEISSCVVLPMGEKDAARSARDAGYRLSDIEAILFKALMQAQDRYGRLPEPDLGCDGRVQKVVEYAEVKRIFAELCPMDDIGEFSDAAAKEKAEKQHRDKLKTRLRRARESLMHEQCNVIGSKGDVIWWTGRPVRDFKETQPPKPKEQTPMASLPDGGDWISEFM